MKRKSKKPLTKRMREIREKINKEEYELDEDGRVVVRINITDADELLSVYNDHGRQIISHDTAQFINNVTKPIPNRQDIHLKISCDSYTKDKEDEYKNAITNYYVNEFAHWDINLRTTLVIALILLGVSTDTINFHSIVQTKQLEKIFRLKIGKFTVEINNKNLCCTMLLQQFNPLIQRNK